MQSTFPEESLAESVYKMKNINVVGVSTMSHKIQMVLRNANKDSEHEAIYNKIFFGSGKKATIDPKHIDSMGLLAAGAYI